MMLDEIAQEMNIAKSQRGSRTRNENKIAQCRRRKARQIWGLKNQGGDIFQDNVIEMSKEVRIRCGFAVCIMVVTCDSGAVEAKT